MLKISLEGLEFFAYHGLYKLERKIGNRYSMNVTVTCKNSTIEKKNELSATIDYEKLYQVVKEEMNIPSKLLENIANRIAKRVFVSFKEAEYVNIVLKKFNPPLGGVCHSASVNLLLRRKK